MHDQSKKHILPKKKSIRALKTPNKHLYRNHIINDRTLYWVNLKHLNTRIINVYI